MALTNNLRFNLPESGSSNNVEIIADAMALIDQALGGQFLHNFIAPGTYTFPPAGTDHLNHLWDFTDTGVVLTSTTVVIVPANVSGTHVVRNQTGQSLSVAYIAGNNAVVLAGETVQIFCNKTEVFLVNP